MRLMPLSLLFLNIRTFNTTTITEDLLLFLTTMTQLSVNITRTQSMQWEREKMQRSYTVYQAHALCTNTRILLVFPWLQTESPWRLKNVWQHVLTFQTCSHEVLHFILRIQQWWRALMRISFTYSTAFDVLNFTF